MKKPTKSVKKAVGLLQSKGLTSPVTGEKDSRLVQMNPRELGLLQQTLHMVGHPNPHTGLLSFDPGNRGSGGPGAGSHDGGPSGGGGPGGSGGGPHSPGGAGGVGGIGGGDPSKGGTPSGGVGRGGPGMSSNALRDMSPMSNPNVSITRDKTNVSPEQAARDQDAQMNATNLGTPGFFSGAKPTAAQLGLRGLLGLAGVDYSPNVTGINDGTVNPDGTTNVTSLTDHVGIDPVHAALSAAGLIPGPIGLAAQLANLGYGGLKQTGVISSPANVGFGFDHGPQGTPSAGNPSSPSGGTRSGGSGSAGPANQDFLNAASGATGNLTGAAPLQSIPSLGLLSQQQPGGVYNTIPGYSYSTMPYKYLQWMPK